MKTTTIRVPVGPEGPMLPPEAVSLLLGVPVDDLQTLSRTSGTDVVWIPPEWVKRGRQRAKEVIAHTGHDRHGVEHGVLGRERPRCTAGDRLHRLGRGHRLVITQYGPYVDQNARNVIDLGLIDGNCAQDDGRAQRHEMVMPL